MKSLFQILFFFGFLLLINASPLLLTPEILGENPSMLSTPDFLLLATMGGAAPTCSQIGCKLLGDKCSGNVLHYGPGPACTKDCCAIGTVCVSGKCQNNNVGASCAKNADCFTVGGQGLCLPSGKCSAIFYPGDSCTYSSQCVGASTCNASTGLCQGVANGEACASTLECQWGSFCSDASHTCAPTGGRDAPCAKSSECQFKFSCIQDTCQPNLSLRKGEPCTPSAHFWEQECQVGLECYPGNNTCVLPPVKWAHKCTSNASCGEYTSCVCNSLSGEDVCASNFLPLTGCESKMSAVNECMEANQCRSSFGHYLQGTCERSKCGALVQSAAQCFCPTLYKVVKNCVALPFDNAASCAKYADDDDELSGGQVAGIVIGVLFGIVVVFAILFWIQSKRGGSTPSYESLN